MYLEIKMVLSSISIICATAVMILVLPSNFFLSFLLIITIGLTLLGDILIGYKITYNNLKPQLDPTPRGKEACILFTLTGGFDVINTTKKPHGKREFRYNQQDASIINKGDCQVKMPNGNSAFIGHESSDETINLAEVKYAEYLLETFGTVDLKDIHAKVIKEVEKDD